MEKPNQLEWDSYRISWAACNATYPLFKWQKYFARFNQLEKAILGAGRDDPSLPFRTTLIYNFIPQLQLKLGNNLSNSTCSYNRHPANTRNFQYKILDRILYTNKSLHKMKIVSSPLCTFCHTSEESLEHLFCYCELSITFWKSVVLCMAKIHKHRF